MLVTHTQLALNTIYVSNVHQIQVIFRVNSKHVRFLVKFLKKNCANNHSMWCLTHVCMTLTILFNVYFCWQVYSPKKVCDRSWVKVQTLLHTWHWGWCPSFHQKSNFRAVPKTVLVVPCVSHVKGTGIQGIKKASRLSEYDFWVV